MILLKRLFFISFLFTIILSSCKKDEFITDSSAKPEFSTDAVLFDTVFTTVGSTTKLFRIYNRHKESLKISKAYLATGSASQFRLNIDGVSGTTINDIEILGGDSLYAFVQVTVNPTNSNSPLLIRDSIIFETNGNIQDIKLTAIGQDVYLHKPNVFPTNGLPAYSITGREGFDTILPNDKPHLMFGYVIIDSDCKLTIQAGTKIYMHNKAVLWAYDKSTLKILGLKGNEVVIQGDRLEPDFKELPGQWGKIWLSSGSKDNIVDWAIIKNGSIGIQVDTLGLSSNPTLQINNTIIKNMTAAALFAQGSFVRSTNCVYANCGQYVTALTLGGRYSFQQCTFANFWSDKRTTPLLALNNYYVDNTNTVQVRLLDSAYFGNCILYGTLAEEIGIDSSNYQAGVFSYKFENCIVKTELNTTNGLHYSSVYKNYDPGFRNASDNNYQLSSTAFSIDKGSTSISVPLDLNNLLRNGIPDLGAYEYYP